VARAQHVGERFHIIWGVGWSNTKIIKIKFIVTFIGRQLADQHTTTDQNKKGTTEEVLERRFN